MFHDLAFLVSGALIGTVMLGLAWLATSERTRRQAVEHALAALREATDKQGTELANLRRSLKSKLYREAMEDKQAQVIQAALRLRVAQRDLADALAILNVNPEGRKQ